MRFGTGAGDGARRANLDAALAACALFLDYTVDDQVSANGRWTAPLYDMRKKLFTEILQGGEDRVRGGLAEAAERRPFYCPCQLLELSYIRHFPFALADPLEDIDQMPCAHSARNTLATGFGLGKAQEIFGGIHNAGVSINYNKAARPHYRTRSREVFIINRRIEELFSQTTPGRTSCLDRLEFLDKAPAYIKYHLAQGSAQRDLNKSGAPYLSHQAEGLGPF
jgi:hypothetical protein